MCIVNYLLVTLSNEEEFKENVKAEVRTATNYLEKVMFRNSLCLRKCEHCQYVCVNIAYHTGECDCGTSHKCSKLCEPCEDPSIFCSLEAGHQSSHICGNKSHICGKICGVAGCSDECFKMLGHNESERCQCKRTIHECGQNCAMFEHCKRSCKIDVEEAHEFHNCEHTACNYNCILCDFQCSSKDHLHELRETTKEIDHPKIPTKRTKLHLCGKEHKCHEICTHAGVCDVTYDNQIRTFTNKYNSFPYNFIVQLERKLGCTVAIDSDNVVHEGEHLCAKVNHRCDVQCPDCKVYCELEYGHEGFHKQTSHRNKDNCIYLAESAEFEQTAEDGTVKKFEAGTEATIENCNMSCVKRGRGHCHPVKCKGGSDCLEVTMSGKAEHSLSTFEPPGDYDLLRCDAYWNMHNWIAPVEAVSESQHRELLKCNFYCNHSSHTTERKFCEALALHTKSDKFCDHTMPDDCSHPVAGVFEIVFVIDLTGSMGAHIEQVRKAVIEIVSFKYPTSVNFFFAVVCFTDHGSASGSLNPDNPTVIFPADGVIANSRPAEVQAFLQSRTCSGGGRMWGEAVMDGLYQASRLTYLPTSKKVIFLATDDRPHGDEFGTGSTHPGGYPCLARYRTSWQNILKEFMNKGADFYNIKLSEQNIAAEKFKKHYGANFRTISLSEAKGSVGTGGGSLASEIATTVKKTVQRCMEFSIRS